MPFEWSKIGIKTKILQGNLFIWDFIRKKYIQSTPEEEVRQWTIYQLINKYKIPPNLIAVERQLIVFNKKKRFDILIYSKLGLPLIIIECKRAKVKLSQNTFNQVSQYNFALKAPYIIITNGLEQIIAQIDFDTRDILFKEELPVFSNL